MSTHGIRTIKPLDIMRISDEININRDQFLAKVDMALKDTHSFSKVICNAIGDISIHEAKQGIIDYFEEKMNQK